MAPVQSVANEIKMLSTQVGALAGNDGRFVRNDFRIAPKRLQEAWPVKRLVTHVIYRRKSWK